MLGRALYAAAFFLLLKYTMDFQPTDKVEGVGDDFVRGGQDQTPLPSLFIAPWTDKSPGGTVTTSAYTMDGKKEVPKSDRRV